MQHDPALRQGVQQPFLDHRAIQQQQQHSSTSQAAMGGRHPADQADIRAAGDDQALRGDVAQHPRRLHGPGRAPRPAACRPGRGGCRPRRTSLPRHGAGLLHATQQVARGEKTRVGAAGVVVDHRPPVPGPGSTTLPRSSAASGTNWPVKITPSHGIRRRAPPCSTSTASTRSTPSIRHQPGREIAPARPNANRATRSPGRPGRRIRGPASIIATGLDAGVAGGQQGRERHEFAADDYRAAKRAACCRQ